MSHMLDFMKHNGKTVTQIAGDLQSISQALKVLGLSDSLSLRIGVMAERLKEYDFELRKAYDTDLNHYLDYARKDLEKNLEVLCYEPE